MRVHVYQEFAKAREAIAFVREYRLRYPYEGYDTSIGITYCKRRCCFVVRGVRFASAN